MTKPIKLKAPAVTNLLIYKLSANYIHIKWDDVGTNFYYFVEISEDGVFWRTLNRTKDTYYFYDGLLKESEYYFRVSVNGEGFESSEWVETEKIKTFRSNLYDITKMNRLQLSDGFVQKRLMNNEEYYINFSNDTIYASLMNAGFTYLTQYSEVKQVDNYILKDASHHEIQGKVSKICTDIDRVMITQFQDVLYMYERFQPVIKVSNDGGQNWYYYRAFSDRIGNPVTKTIAYQNSTTSYILGYTKLFFGRPPPADYRFSSDVIKFSSNDVSFSKIGRDDSIPFETEIFSSFATLPADVSKRVESIVVNDKFLYVASRGKIRYISLINTPIEDDVSSPLYGEKKFEDEILTIGNDKVVIKKMDCVDGNIFALVTGEVETYGKDPRKNPVVASIFSGVYKLTDVGFVRIYGNTEKERSMITHKHTNMSTNGTDLFIGTGNFNHNDEFKLGLTANKDIHYALISTNSVSDFNEWKYSNQEYYNEFNFSYFHRDKARTWIDNSYNSVVVFPSKIYSKVIDPVGKTSPNRIQKEIWKNGKGVFIAPDIEFSNFGKYAGGILLHKASGEIFGYYEFDYRVRDYVKLQWKPKLTVIDVDLKNQVHKIPYIPKEQTGLKDPNLVPLIHTMNPESYITEDSEFTMFITRYLEFISEGSSSSYIKLLNLIKNKHNREPDAFEYLFSEAYKRNIYLDKEKRDSVIRFFETRKSDFYSMKGTEASYKFLFKLLYNEDVEIDIESKNTIEYDIVVESDNITEDIVGTTITTATGKANVTYIDREYIKGKLTWRITIHNLLGRYIEGQIIKSDITSFTGLIKVGVRGKDMLSNSLDYIDRGKSSYIMRIKSQLPASRYKDDMLRFVHPVGFGFIGVTLLTILINSGLNMRHVETIIRKLKTYKFDAGYPTKWPNEVLATRPDGTVEKNPITGEVLYRDHPKRGQDFIIPVEELAEYNELGGILGGMQPSDLARRSPTSPLFDASGTAWSMFKSLQENILKDNIGNPRDPIESNQEKYDE